MKKFRLKRIVSGFGLLCLCIAGGLYFFYFRAPSDFPKGTIVTIKSGETVRGVAEAFESAHLVRSGLWLTNFVILVGNEARVTEGDYFFPETESVYSIAQRITHGTYKLAPTKITIPEGSSVADIAAILKSNFPLFNSKEFLSKARDQEGYLFPDTYYFMANTPVDDIIKKLRTTFDQKMGSLRITIDTFNRPFDEVVTMASILEGEARQYETRRIVAGILWKRIEIGMPLQVDATFKYINGKGSAELTMADLKIKSPYNTYVNKGLPPTPISNPGYDAIKAALNPKSNPYIYFLTGKDGEMHYAKTLEEHVVNKRKYLS